jgi:superfamily I DNA/RNA helicase
MSALSALDLDAVVPTLVARLENEPLSRERVLDGIDHLFVDEFQDLNASQYRLVEIIGTKASVFAIGDPDQSIYGFRGSDPSFFFRFAAEPGVRPVTLVRNYRSAPLLIEAASAVIGRNSGRTGASLIPASLGEGRIELHTMPTPASEAELVVRRIEEFMGGISSFSLASGRGGDRGAGRSFGEMAILYRLTRQAEELATALNRRGIPYQLVGATPYFLSPGCRAVTRFLWLAAGSRETSDWLSLLADLPGFGRSVLEKMDAELPLAGDFAALARELDLGEPVRLRLGQLESALEDFRRSASVGGLRSALTEITHFLGVPPSHPDCDRLLSLAGSFGAGLDALSLHLRRHAAETVYDEQAEAVSLMTLHSAKGLEFPVVFITGCEEGLLPCTLWGDADVEEERRLFYVGMTRARETLVLTASNTRPWSGPGERRLSRFVAEIPERLVERSVEQRKGRVKKAEQMELF